MKRIFSSLLILVILFSLTYSGLVSAQKDNDREKQETYLIAFNSKINSELIRNQGGQIKRKFKYMPVIAASLSDKAVANLSKNPHIKYIEIDSNVNADNQTLPWGIEHINADDTRLYFDSNENDIKVAILDTGIDKSHEDLFVSGGVSFVEGVSDYSDDNGHGTHIAGIISGLNNTFGVVGVAPTIHLYSIKVLDQYGNGNYSDVIAGIEWAISNNIDIINMSLGGKRRSKSLQRILDKAYERGIVLVASAGNNGYERKGSISYPAKYDTVIAVGAIDKQNKRASFSSVGKELELTAPGVDILSTMPNGTYGLNSGTSMAAPHVSGVAAILLQKDKTYTNENIRYILNSSAIKLGSQFEYGNGLVDALNALNFSTKVGE